MNQKELDLQFGKEQEERLLTTIQRHFNDETIKPTEDQFSYYDFQGKEYLFELKSRRNKLTAYPDTIISKNKIDKYDESKEDRNFVFLFNFTDGLYYVKYNKDLFNSLKISSITRYDRGRPEQSLYLCIPINHLTIINKG
jgi:hypothetical protein